MSVETASREELLLRLEALTTTTTLEKRDLERALHDLQVHQIELELQNRELREARAALEASRNSYADLYDFAPIPYFTLDDTGCIAEANLTGATLVGRERGQLIGMPFVALVELAEPARFWAHLRRCGTSREPVVTELALRARGVARLVRAISTAVSGPADAPPSFRTAFIDVTDRHVAELAQTEAHEAERRLRQELESLDVAKTVLARSLATVTEHSLPAILQLVVDEARLVAAADYAALGTAVGAGDRFTSWVFSGIDAATAAAIGAFPRAVGTLGLAIRDATTLRVADLAAHPSFAGLPPHHPPMTSMLAVPIWFGEQVVGNLYLTNKRGAAEFTHDDERGIESLARYVGMAMEIARLGDQARAAIQARDTMLAIVSHDLRSPLSAITVSARLLSRLLLPLDVPMARRQTETIGRAADRMNRFIDDLLTASTIDAGRLTMAPRTTAIGQLVTDAVEAYAFVASEASVAIAATIPEGLRDVTCDPDRIHQVLANLIGNAVKFTPAGGHITVSVVERASELEITVTDTGPGIRADLQPHVFDRYWKGGATATGPGGVGLGLYIARGIVQSHGGRIWVESTPTTGTRFRFTLPSAPAAAAAAP